MAKDGRGRWSRWAWAWAVIADVLVIAGAAHRFYRELSEGEPSFFTFLWPPALAAAALDLSFRLRHGPGA